MYNNANHTKKAVLTMRTLLFLMAATLFVGCHDDDNKKKEDKSASIVTLVYMAGESNLTSDAIIDFNEMFIGCKYLTENDRLIVYIDNAEKNKKPSIYELRKNTSQEFSKSKEPIFTFDTDHISTSPHVLDSVLSFTYSNYQADSYRIVFWSHGSGWVPSNHHTTENSNSIKRPILKAFGVDTGINDSGSSQGEQMNISDIAKVLSKYHSIDLVMFDACFMQTIEVAYELRNTARYIIGSPAEIPGWGAPYDEILQPMFADELNANAIIARYHSFYKEKYPWYGILLSAIDCSELENFAAVHRSMINTYKENIKGIELTNVLNYFIFDSWKAQSDLPDHYDIKGLMQRIITDNNDYRTWEESLNRLVPYSCMDSQWYTMYSFPEMDDFNHKMDVDASQFSGVTMYLEQDKYKSHYYYDSYPLTAWGKLMK